MCVASDVFVGAIAVVKMGRNEVTVEVTAILENGWRVKSQASGREFEVTRIERILNGQPEVAETVVAEPCALATEPTVEPAPETEPVADASAAPEPAKAPKKLSLLNAAAQVLATCRIPMNTKELVAKAVEMNLWIHTGAKTPEQTLYSGIFREIKSGSGSRFKKSETKKGAFEYALEK